MATGFLNVVSENLDMDDIHDTAGDYYLAMIANGKVPLEVVGGPLDGVRYFEVEIDGRKYWVTDRGLFDPPEASTDHECPGGCGYRGRTSRPSGHEPELPVSTRTLRPTGRVPLQCCAGSTCGGFILVAYSGAASIRATPGSSTVVSAAPYRTGPLGRSVRR